jgi:hypothetical protein
VLRKHLKLYAYTVKIGQAVQNSDKPKRKDFAVHMLNRINEDNAFLQRLLFSDEATFHLSGRVNHHNIRIWDSEQPRVVRQHRRESPKVNVWCGLMHDCIIGPFFFAEKTVTANVYSDMLEQSVIPQLQEKLPYIMFQQTGRPHIGLFL